ncbi:unnamed protein product [Rhodiola kirilowii]
MQKLRSLVPATRLRLATRNQTHRVFSAEPAYSLYDDSEKEVLVEGRAKMRAAILHRPSALNTLTTTMAARLRRLYESWEDNPDVNFVVTKAGGKAFSAGSDVVALRQLMNEGRPEECNIFFKTLYNLVYLVGTYLKPHIPILNGIVMGGGAGIAVPAMFRIATDKTIFASPEAQMGFHPDAGASFYLSRLPGYLGEYLALTGEKLKGVEMIACGLATHYSLSARLDMIEERLGSLVTDDPSIIENSLAQYGDIVYPDKTSIISRLDTIDKCFSHDTVEEIIDAVERETASSHDEWCKRILLKLKDASPISLKVSLRSIRDGRFQTLDQCLAREYRISLATISKQVSNDFCEGVRARLVDKDFAPKWDPSSLSDVTKDMVDSYFSPPREAAEELKLPTEQREPFV